MNVYTLTFEKEDENGEFRKTFRTSWASKELAIKELLRLIDFDLNHRMVYRFQITETTLKGSAFE